MKNLNLALIGYGKMGQTIEKFALEKSFSIVLRADSKNTLAKQEDALQNVDVAIEFTSPEAAPENLEILAGHGVNTVCGSTAWLDHYDRICSLFNKSEAAFLYASNFSIGVNVFFAVNKKLAALMNGLDSYKVDILEAHHIQKKDAPSGTAVTLAEQIIENNNTKNSWKLVHGENESADNKIPVKVIRKGDIKGTHQIRYRSSVDEICIRHEAFSRDGFASGALLAAEWLHERTGIYDMNDVLGIG